MKKIIVIFLIFFSTLQTQAFEDYIVSTNGKLTNIKIENNQIINIHYLTTIFNEKNTIFVTPINIGETYFSVIKNEKDKFTFKVKVDEDETFITENEGFEIIPFDTPPPILDCDIDAPPMLKKEKETINIDGAIIEIDSKEGE